MANGYQASSHILCQLCHHPQEELSEKHSCGRNIQALEETTAGYTLNTPTLTRPSCGQLNALY